MGLLKDLQLPQLEAGCISTANLRFNQVIGTSCAVIADPLSPFENFLAPSAILSPHYIALMSTSMSFCVHVYLGQTVQWGRYNFEKGIIGRIQLCIEWEMRRYKENDSYINCVMIAFIWVSTRMISLLSVNLRRGLFNPENYLLKCIVIKLLIELNYWLFDSAITLLQILFSTLSNFLIIGKVDFWHTWF